MKKIYFIIIPLIFIFIFASGKLSFSKNPSSLGLLSKKSVPSKVFKKEFEFESYEKAKEADNFIRLDMSSTHFGLYTNQFEGFISHFQFLGILSKQYILRSKIIFKVQSINTDLEIRDNIIHDDGFQYKKYPEIVVSLKENVALKDQMQKIKGTITIRGKKKEIPLWVKVVGEGEKEQGKYKVEGESKIRLSDLGINDLSIPTITIHDDVKISFRIFIEKENG